MLFVHASILLLEKEYQFLKTILSREETETSRNLNSVSAYYDAMFFLLKAREFFYRQAECPVVLNPKTLNIEYKKLIVDYMSDCENEEHLHTR